MSKQSAKRSSTPEQNPRCVVRLLVCWLEGAAKLQPASTGMHMDEVVAIREKLATGTYNVPSSQVADKIIECLLKAKL